MQFKINHSTDNEKEYNEIVEVMNRYAKPEEIPQSKRGAKCKICGMYEILHGNIKSHEFTKEEENNAD